MEEVDENKGSYHEDMNHCIDRTVKTLAIPA